jgi:flagellar biosynthesis protein FliR
VRTLAIFAPLPVFGQGVSARFAKLGLGATLGFLSFGVHGAAFHDPGPEPLALLIAGFGETLFGLLLGWTARLLIDALRIAGSFVSNEMGLNLASQFDPATGQSMPLVAYLYEHVGLVLFFALGAHHAVIAAIFRSFAAVPAGRPVEFERILPSLAGFGGGLVEAGFRMAAPCFFALLLVGVVLAFLAKVAPQWHLLDAGYPLRAAVGLVLLGLTAPVLLPLVDGAVATTKDALMALTEPA